MGTLPTPFGSISHDTSNTPSRAVLDLVENGRKMMRLYDVEGYEEAVGHFRDALQLAPGFAPIHVGLAETYAYWGFRREISGLEYDSYYELAYGYAEMALRLSPDTGACHRAMAVALRRGERSDPLRRKEHIQTALDLNPSDAETWYEHWRAFGYEPTHPSIKRALELEPDLCGAYIDLGVVLCERGQFKEAAVHLRRALQINPRNALALYNLAMVLDRQGHRAKTRDILEHGRQLHPDDPLIEGGIINLTEAK